MRLIFAFLLVLFTTELVAQKAESEFNSISRDRVLFELGYNGWLNTPDQPENLETRWYNRGVNLYFMWDFILGDKKTSRFAFAPGLGFSNHNVYHNARFDRDRDVDSPTFDQTVFNLIPDSLSYRKGSNKLSTTYVEAPLEFRFRSKVDQYNSSWKLAIGMRVGYLLVNNAKYRGDEVNVFGEINNVKTKDLVISGINRFRFGPSVRIGYGYVSLVGYMSLNSLFEENQGPAVQPFSIGLTFNSF